MGTTMPITFTCDCRCPRCGHESFTSIYRPADFAPVTCLACGHLTTAGNAIHAFQAEEPETKSFRDPNL
jgi:Zn ribbon nucleic-acid-binding protein